MKVAQSCESGARCLPLNILCYKTEFTLILDSRKLDPTTGFAIFWENILFCLEFTFLNCKMRIAVSSLLTLWDFYDEPVRFVLESHVQAIECFKLNLCPTDFQIMQNIYVLLGDWLRWQRIRLQCRRPGFDPWVGKTPWRRAWQPTLVFLPGESHGQRSLVGYSPWGHRESDMTEQLSIIAQGKNIKFHFVPTDKSRTPTILHRITPYKIILGSKTLKHHAHTYLKCLYHLWLPSHEHCSQPQIVPRKRYWIFLSLFLAIRDWPRDFFLQMSLDLKSPLAQEFSLGS